MKRTTTLNKCYMRAKRAHTDEGPHTSIDVINAPINTSCYNPNSSDDDRPLSPSIHNEDVPLDEVDMSSSESYSDITNIQVEDHFNYPSNLQHEIKNSFKTNLMEWAIKHNISHIALNELLKLLQPLSTEPLPVDARTLLRTIRTVQVKPLIKFDF
ncbi:hypothetical protein RI129_010990 [Pyrocoelia pectoralis]|uniref:Uncharacterized protein n=1 Tax=Pyrocoelia pectoralis TaxID=417401 RepID=A0AAN7V5E2_9COLE